MVKKRGMDSVILKVFANFVIVILVISLFGFNVVAQTDNEQAAQQGAIAFPEAGLTSNSPFHGFELWLERREIESATVAEKLRLEKGYLEERYAEMRELVLDGDTDAETAAEEARKMHENIAAHIKEYIN